MANSDVLIPLQNHIRLDVGNRFQRFTKRENGYASYFYDIRSPIDDTLDLWKALFDFSQQRNIPIKVIGGGTNLFITNEGFGGLLVRYLYRDVKIQVRDDLLNCSSGVNLHGLVLAAADKGMDLSFLAGIPGTVGGAVAGNAGSSTWNRNIGEVTASISTFDLKTGTEKIFYPSELINGLPFFAQRTNYLKEENRPTTRYVIRATTFRPPREVNTVIKDKIAERLQQRRSVDKEGVGTAGSFFASAILPQRLSEIDGKKMLVRDLITSTSVHYGSKVIPIPNFAINQACFTKRYAFFKTGAKSTDHDAATVISAVLKAVVDQYKFTPRLEVDLIGSAGSMTIDDFIKKFAMTMTGFDCLKAQGSKSDK